MRFSATKSECFRRHVILQLALVFHCPVWEGFGVTDTSSGFETSMNSGPGGFSPHDCGPLKKKERGVEVVPIRLYE